MVKCWFECFVVVVFLQWCVCLPVKAFWKWKCCIEGKEILFYLWFRWRFPPFLSACGQKEVSSSGPGRQSTKKERDDLWSLVFAGGFTPSVPVMLMLAWGCKCDICVSTIFCMASCFFQTAEKEAHSGPAEKHRSESLSISIRNPNPSRISVCALFWRYSVMVLRVSRAACCVWVSGSLSSSSVLTDGWLCDKRKFIRCLQWPSAARLWWLKLGRACKCMWKLQLGLPDNKTLDK